MANILENIKEHGLVGGLVEAARDSFGKGKYQGPAHFYVVDENGDKTEVSNESATPIYKTPTGFSNTRSYAYLTQGDNGKLTLNYSSDLADSDAFRKNYLDNNTFKEVVRSYNANTNADTVIQTKNEDGTVENVKFSDLINNYNTALNEFASNYEGFSLVRDNFKNNTGFDLSDEEIRIATNTIGDDDKKSETKAIFLPQEWLSIYDFSKLPSFDADTKTVSAKDFFEAYDLDKDGGINEEAWNEMIGSANGIVANAYSGNMKKNVYEDAEGDEEAIATAKDRLVRAYSASNLLASHDPEQSFLHTVGIVSSNAVLTLGNNVSQVVGKFATLEGAVIDSVTYFGELGIASIKDKSIQMATLQGAVAEDFQSGAVTPSNFNEYIDGILVSSTDGSMSEVEKVKAEWQAKIKGKQTLADLSYAEGTTFRDMQDAVDWQIAYTAEIAPVAAQAGAIMGEFAFLALEVAVANGLGSSTGALVSSEAGTVKALSTAFKSTSTLTRLKALAGFAARNKMVSFSANMLTQAMVDTFVFEDTDTFLNAWARLDPGAQKELSRAFADNLVGNSVAEVIGIGSSAIGGKLAASNNKGILWIRSRAAKAAAWASLPKKKAQAAFAGTKMAQLLSKPIGKGARQTSDMFIKAVNEGTGTVFKSKTLEEYNVEKFQMEYAATKNIANAKAGDVIVTDFEKNTTKVSETTTEAILGKVAEKTNFLNQAARIAEGVKATTDRIVADETVGAAYKGVTDGAVELQKTLKWKDFNPAMGKYLSQDASNYVANKVHFDDLTRKKSILEAKKKALSPLEQKKLEDLSNWLKEFAITHSDDAIDALNLFIEKQQALNKALTDWQVRNGIMTKATYDSLAGTGYYGANDEFYVKTVAIPNGKTMEELDEEVNASIYVETQRDFLNGAGVRGANYVYKQDMHLSNSIDSNYLDPVLVNSLTIDNIAKAYQGRMWYNSMVAIKAPTREIDVTGKPIKKREIENVMKHARNSAEEAIDSVSLSELGEGTLGKTFQESSTTVVKGKGKDRVEIRKVDKYQEKVNRKLGIADDKQIVTNVGILDEAQTKTVLATFGNEAPAYGKCKTNKELKATFEGLSEKQQEQALKAMGKNPVETKKTVTTQKKNPEYAAWKKEKAAFEKEQAKAKKAFDKEQAKLAKQSTKKTSTKFPKEAKKQLEKDMRDAILYDSNTDIKSWKEFSTDDVNAKLTDARKKEIGNILKDDFDIDKFRELDNPKIEDAIKPEYIEQVRAKYGEDITEESIATIETKTFEEKTFDKPAPDEFLAETSTKVDKSNIKAIDEPGALRAWNQAVTNTSMIDDLNKTFIAERVNPAEGGPKKMTEATKKTLTDAIAEKTKYNFSPESVSVEGKTMDDLVEEFTKKGNKEDAYNEAVKKLEDAQEMEKAVAEGTDPFSLSTMEFGESVIEIGAYRLKNSAVGPDLAKKASEYGIEDDSIFEYYVLSSMVENAPDGTIRLSKKFKRAFEDKYEARFLKAPNAEGKMDQLGLKKLMNDAEEKIERLVVGRWASYQNDLVERGATDLIDTNKYFDAIEGEMKKIAGDISGNRNIIQVLDASGEYKYVEVDPIVADLYRSRPYNNRDNDSFIRKLSRLSRLGKTSLNPVSVMNQNFKDAIQSFVMAGWAHSVTTYSKEIAEMFGDQFVNYLRESMGEEGWLKFSEGLTDSETRLKATELLTTGKMGAEPFAGNLTSRQLFRKNAPQEDLAGQIRNEAAEAYSYLGGYTKKKGLSAKKNAKKGLIDAIEDISPGGTINNWRETYFRKANYTSAMNDALKRGETLSQARATAEFVSRNATTNFRNTFMWGNIICDNVPFLSAAINGSASFWRLFEMDPVGVLTRINAAGMAVIAQVISSGQSLEDRNTLKDVPDWVKRSGAVFIVNGSVYTIPLPEEIAVFLAPFRQTAEKMLGSEDRSWVELLYNDALEISPINLDGFSTDDQSKLTKNQGLLSRLGRQVQVLLSQVSPPIVKTAIMAATGVDPYTGNEIDNSYVWYDEDGNRQIMDYTTSETARGLANISKQFNWNISPSMAQSLFEEALGTGFLQMSDDVINLYEAFFSGKNVDGENIDRTKTAFSPITSAVENAASAVVVEDYQIKDKYDKDFKAMITSLERKKNELLTPGSTYMDTLEQMSKLKSTDGNYDTKKQNLTQQAMQEIEDFRKEALFAVNTYVKHYGSDYDDKKFASVVALLNFNNPTGVIQTSAKDFQDSQSAYYRGREDAYQTMIDLGFKSVNDYSILGIAKRNSQTGEIYTKFNSPVAILNAGESVWSSMAENVNAEIAAALEVAGIDRGEMFDGYYKAKAQGKAAAKQYKKDWNAKIVKAIAPTVYQYGADQVLENSTVQDYLDNYIFISNPYKTGDYLKEIFEVED